MCCACEGGFGEPTFNIDTCPCIDTDEGVVDSGGNGCSYYETNPISSCGRYDTGSFSSEEMCCACGGGSDYIIPTCSIESLFVPTSFK